jgi:phosphoribosylformylglycinamidine (FGAM) synthase PurS component
MKTEVLVKLAARDPWSFTVLDALKRKFGIETIVGVERLKSWRLDFDPDSKEDAIAVTEKILDETALLANPNRDIRAVRGRSRLVLPWALPGAAGREDSFFAVRVTDRDDLVGRSMYAILQRRLGISEITGVAFSLVWILEFDRPGDESFRLAEEIAVARSWRRGLLANPHCQEAVVLGLGDYLGGGEGPI